MKKIKKKTGKRDSRPQCVARPHQQNPRRRGLLARDVAQGNAGERRGKKSGAANSRAGKWNLMEKAQGRGREPGSAQHRAAVFFQRVQDGLHILVRLLAGEGAVIGAQDQVEGHRLFAFAQVFAPVDVEQGDFLQ